MGFQAIMYGSQKSHYPWLKCHKHEEKLTMTMFWEMTIESKLLNKFHWSWYLSFRRQCFIHEDDEMKKCYIFEYQSNENQAFRFFWDTRYSIQALVNHMLITYMYATNWVSLEDGRFTLAGSINPSRIGYRKNIKERVATCSNVPLSTLDHVSRAQSFKINIDGWKDRALRFQNPRVSFIKT